MCLKLTVTNKLKISIKKRSIHSSFTSSLSSSYGKKERGEDKVVKEEMEQESLNGTFDDRVMTEEQMEALRKQIAIYAVLCDQLVFLHNSLSSVPLLSSGTYNTP